MLQPKNPEKNSTYILIPHPAYSPDPGPSDFYLFEKLKQKFEGVMFESAEELEDAIRDEFSKISKDELKSVFNGCIKRLQRCIEIGGAYI